MGKVYLVGAGPGDPMLITVKGAQLLKICDAVVYDRLVSNELLDYVKPECKRVYVGKQAGYHSKTQEEINEILVECAIQFDIVIRLKGGDPFVFGRSADEIDALLQSQIEFEVVPGITSAIAVPECAGIPVTHRGISRSFHVITGHTNQESGLANCDYETLSKLEGTLIFLMGLGNLTTITSELIRNGKTPDTPTAVISSGTTSSQQVVRGTLNTIVNEVEKSKLKSPAVIVIGATAAYDYRYYRSLLPKKIGITATKALKEKLENKFKRMGAITETICDMEVVPTVNINKLDREIARLDSYQWILFTSQNGVDLFFERLKTRSFDFRVLSRIKFAAIGSGTAKKLEECGITSDFIPTKYTVAVLGEEFSSIVGKKEKVLIPRAVRGSQELLDILTKQGISYKEIAIYDVIGTATDKLQYMNQMDCLVFGSASGVKAFFKEIKKENLSLSKDVKIACIGEVTYEAVKSENREADIIASTNNADGLVEAVKNYYLKDGALT